MLTFNQWLEYSCEGMTITADLWWSQPQEFLTTRSYKLFENMLLGVCRAAKLVVTDHKLLSYQGQLHPEWGYSYLVVLDQSHIMVHTWPEHNMLNIDIFTCGTEANPQTVLDGLKLAAQPDQVTHKQMKRGVRQDIRSPEEAEALQKQGKL